MERSRASITQTRAACYFFTFYKPIVKKREKSSQSWTQFSPEARYFAFRD